jgi:hypothetical protein
MLGVGDLQGFAETGILRLPQAFRTEDALAMEDMIWRFVAARGVIRTDPSTWLPGAVPGLSPKMKRKATFQLGWAPAVTEAVDQLLDGDWDPPNNCGALLVTFPDSVHWHVPRRIWHADTHFAHEPEPLFGVKTYGFINSVVAGQGETCVISGSYHLVRRFAQTNLEAVRALRHLPMFMKSHLGSSSYSMDLTTRTGRDGWCRPQRSMDTKSESSSSPASPAMWCSRTRGPCTASHRTPAIARE